MNGLRGSGMKVLAVVALVLMSGACVPLQPGPMKATAVSAGGLNACALRNDGTVQCWGDNHHGQLGNGTAGDYSVMPVMVIAVYDAIDVTTGDGHACALISDGTVRCWGSNVYGQLGNGSTVDFWLALPVPELTGVVAISAGKHHTCAAVSDGTARCWGYNGQGQLGDGTTTNSAMPVTVSGLTDAVAIAGGGTSTCAVISDGTARCWGENRTGQLGDGTATSSLIPVTVTGLTDAVAITAGSWSTYPMNGGSHACALISDGTTRCWGDNTYGQLGDGTTTDSRVPVTAGDLTDVVAVSAGDTHICAVISDGTARCWGDNRSGQLGDGTTIDSTVRVTVTGLTDAASVSAGSGFACTATADGDARCWGNNEKGQLGNGIASRSSSPISIRGLTGAAAVSVGGYAQRLRGAGSQTCALGTDGTTRCWGDNQFGQLGNGTTTRSNLPTDIALTNTIALAVGDTSACAVVSDGTARCWGENGNGQLGNGTTTDSNVPVAVTGLTDAVAISANGWNEIWWDGSHTCALISDGTVRCWGSNRYGQLGDGTTTDSKVPLTVAGVTNAVAVSVGSTHVCALISDGTALCWGGNRAGQLGDGTSTSSMVPVTVTGLTDAVSISAGASHTCAVVSDGTVKCWGYNLAGQLGDGSTTIYSTTPVTATGITSAVAVSAGTRSTCAVLSDRTARCWGDNTWGQLGDGTSTDSLVPVTVTGLTDVVAISTGGWDFGTPPGSHTCALIADGTARCWGDNRSGQLGNGGGFSNTPSQVVGFH